MTDEQKIERLRNYLSPVINYFFLLEALHKCPVEQTKEIGRLLHAEEKVVYEVIPKVKEILNEETAKDLPFHCHECKGIDGHRQTCSEFIR